MAELIFISGGCRSGKSSFAEKLCTEIEGEKLYLATCPQIVGDEEMQQRIFHHQQQRAEHNWRTLEEELFPAKVIAEAKEDAILLDCLTLWVNNLIYRESELQRELSEDEMTRLASGLAQTCLNSAAQRIVLVSNEVGMGLVPDNALGRRYRDLIGRCNMAIATRATRVAFLLSGLPIWLES